MSKHVIRKGSSDKIGSFSNQLELIDPGLLSTTGREVAKLEDPTERRRRQGYEDGHKIGYSEGFAAGQSAGEVAMIRERSRLINNEVDQFKNDLAQTLHDVQRAIIDWEKQAESALTGLGVVIAQRILARELNDPQAAVETARQLMQEISLVKKIKLKVNPLHSQAVRDQRDLLLSATEGLQEIEIIDDPSIAGGCVVESDLGIIDATVQTQLANVVEAFRVSPPPASLKVAA